MRLEGDLNQKTKTFDRSLATGNLNDSGTISGDYYDAAGAKHGFIYSKGTWQQVDVPGAGGVTPIWGLGGTAVTRIKNKGQLVGDFTDRRKNSTAEAHGFTSPQ